MEGDAADFTVSVNGTYDFIITDNGGNTTTLHTEVGNVDTARPAVDFHFEPLDGGDRTIITEYGKTEYYNYDLVMKASAGDVGSGLGRYEYKAGDGEWTVFDPADPPEFTEEQIIHIAVRVWDVAGNVSEEKARHRAGQNAAHGFAYADARQGRKGEHQPRNGRRHLRRPVITRPGRQCGIWRGYARV